MRQHAHRKTEQDVRRRTPMDCCIPEECHYKWNQRQSFCIASLRYNVYPSNGIRQPVLHSILSRIPEDCIGRRTALTPEELARTDPVPAPWRGRTSAPGRVQAPALKRARSPHPGGSEPSAHGGGDPYSILMPEHRGQFHAWRDRQTVQDTPRPTCSSRHAETDKQFKARRNR